MACPLTLILVHKMGGQVRIRVLHIIMDFLPQVSHHEYKLADSGFLQLVNDKTQDRFSGNGNQRFWLCIGMRPEFGTRAGNRYNCFHRIAFLWSFPGRSAVLKLSRKSVAGRKTPVSME
jgi:hypothetical protein